MNSLQLTVPGSCHSGTPIASAQVTASGQTSVARTSGLTYSIRIGCAKRSPCPSTVAMRRCAVGVQPVVRADVVDGRGGGRRIERHAQELVSLDTGRDGKAGLDEVRPVAVAGSEQRRWRPGGCDPSLGEPVPCETQHLLDALRIDQPKVADGRGEMQLGHVAYLDADVGAAALHEGAQLDEEAVLVTHLLGDAVAVRGEPVAERVAVDVEQPADLVERQLERAQAPDRDGVLDLRCVVVAVPGVGIDLRGAREARSRRSGGAP